MPVGTTRKTALSVAAEMLDSMAGVLWNMLVFWVRLTIE
jgi:hypothetical protein